MRYFNEDYHNRFFYSVGASNRAMDFMARLIFFRDDRPHWIADLYRGNAVAVQKKKVAHPSLAATFSGARLVFCFVIPSFYSGQALNEVKDLPHSNSRADVSFISMTETREDDIKRRFLVASLCRNDVYLSISYLL